MSKETKIDPSLVKEKVEDVDETIKDVQSIDRYNTVLSIFRIARNDKR